MKRDDVAGVPRTSEIGFADPEGPPSLRLESAAKCEAAAVVISDQLPEQQHVKRDSIADSNWFVAGVDSVGIRQQIDDGHLVVDQLGGSRTTSLGTRPPAWKIRR